MGDVYRGIDLRSRAWVAVKIARWPDEVSIQRFMREADALSRLNHPGIVGYVAHGLAAEQTPYLVMQWLEGEDLGQRLSRGPLSVADTLSVGIQAADALRHAHEHGILHRDVKPGNLFLVRRDIDRLALIDFGLARMPMGNGDFMSMTGVGELIGTPGFIAPEQARGIKDLDERTDLYSLGVMLFTCLTQKPPFLASHIAGSLAKLLFEAVPRVSEIRGDIPPALDGLIARLMSRDPERRPMTAARVLVHLERLRNAPDLVQPPSIRSSPEPSVPSSGPATDDDQAGLFWSLLVIGDQETGHRQKLDQSWIRSVAERHDAGVVATPSDRATALLCSDRDLAAAVSRSARCALEVRANNTSVPLAIATGRGRPEPAELERAVAMWRDDDSPNQLPYQFATPVTPGSLMESSNRSSPRSPQSPRSPIDVIASELMTGRFEVTPSAPACTGTSSRRCPGDRPSETGAHSGDRAEQCQPIDFSHLVGRETELVALESALDRCMDENKAQLSLVLGPAGTGKSRLRREFTEHIATAGSPEAGNWPKLWLVQGEPTHTRSPFGLLGRILRRALGLSPGDSITEHRKRLAERVCRNVHSGVYGTGDTERIAVFLGETLDADLTDPNHPLLRTAGVDSRFMREQIEWALHDWLAAETARQPVLIVIDDAHWSDRVSLRILGSVLRSLADRPLMLLALARPPGDSADASDIRSLLPSESADVIDLAPLGDLVSRKLVMQMLPSISDGLADRLVTAAAGNALHLQLLTHVVAEGEPCDLPTTIADAVAARIAQLDPDDRRALAAASVVGRSFPLAAVEALLDGTAESTRLAVSRMVERGLLEYNRPENAASDREYSFTSSRVRDALYAGLRSSTRQRLHLRMARWLEATGAADGSVLAGHWLGGNAVDGALPWLLAGAERALIAGEYRDALDLAARVAAHGTSRDTLGRLSAIQAEAYNLIGQHEAAYLCACNAMDLLPRSNPSWTRAARHVLWAASAINGCSDDEAQSPALAATMDQRILALFPDESSQRAMMTPLSGTSDIIRGALTASGAESHVAEAVSALESDVTLSWLVHGHKVPQTGQRSDDAGNGHSGRCRSPSGLRPNDYRPLENTLLRGQTHAAELPHWRPKRETTGSSITVP